MRFELPLQRQGERVSKADPEYEELLSTLPGNHIKSAMQSFLDEVGIRKDVRFVEAPNLGLCMAIGTNTFRSGDAVVFVVSGFYKADKDACSFIMKHEIGHIKQNDTCTTKAVPCGCQLAASIFGMCSLSFFPALVLSYTTGIVSKALFSQWREARADDFAIEKSSDEELQGGRRFFMALRDSHLQERSTFWTRIAISASGEARFDIEHPSLTSRIQKIERAMRARNIDIDAIDVEAQIQRPNRGLTAYITNAKREIREAVQRARGNLSLMKRIYSF